MRRVSNRRLGQIIKGLRIHDTLDNLPSVSTVKRRRLLHQLVRRQEQ